MFDNENDFENIVDRLNIDAEPNDVHRQNLRRQMLSAFNESQQKTLLHTTTWQNVWRTIMKNRITKFAAAAVIITVMLITISQFTSGTPVFASMIKNTERMRWVHMVAFTFSGSKESRIETWISTTSKVRAEKWDDDRLIFVSGSEKKEYLYDPLQNNIFISSTDYSTSSFFSPITLMRTFIARLEAASASIKREEKLIDSVRTEIIRGQIPDSNQTVNVELYRDITNNLLMRMEVIFPDHSKNILAVYDYPETGPTSITELGAPGEAKTVDLTEPFELQEFSKKIDIAKTTSMKRYVAIGLPCDSNQLPSSFSGEQSAATRLWRDNDNWRCDLGYYTEDSMITPKTLTEDIQCSAKFLTPVVSYIVTKRKTYSLVRKEWGDGKIEERTNVSYPGNLSIEEVCWPRMSGTVGVPVKWEIESVTGANGESLVLIERTQDGRIPNDKGVSVRPTRDRWFFNPERDYICQKHEHCEFLYGDWLINKHWLDGQENPRYEWAGRDYQNIVEILEYAQTSLGSWYPRVIKENHLWYNDNDSGETTIDQRSSYSVCRKIYLEENPDIPNEIFDPEKLTD